MQVPVSLYWGGQDWLTVPAEILQLIPQLPNLRGNVELQDYDHLDFIWGMDAAKRVYQPIINEIQKLERATAVPVKGNFLEKDGYGSGEDANELDTMRGFMNDIFY